jgi:hypothetical protein
MILSDGRTYLIELLLEGANPNRIIEEKYPGWIFVEDAHTKEEADSRIEQDRARRRPDWY